jgi:hypothetical protein
VEDALTAAFENIDRNDETYRALATAGHAPEDRSA